MKERGMRDVGLGLLAVCFLIAWGAWDKEPLELAAGGGAVVEIEEPHPVVALTFDDGPRPNTTGPLLEGLALREVPATFFLVGERIPGSEDLVRRMISEGHQVGVHTYNHVKLTGLNREQYQGQVGRVRDLLTASVGRRDYWLRPPYGIINQDIKSWADGPLVLWSVDPEDWKDQDQQRIVETVLSHVKDGDVILMHDIYQNSVNAALEIVDTLLDQGYSFVTVEQLMQLRGVEPKPGLVVHALPPKSD